MQMVNNRLPVAAIEGAGAPSSAARSSDGALVGVRSLARRTARLTASTGLAGSLALAGLMGSTAMPGGMAQAQVTNVCTGLSLNESVLRDRLIPLLQAVVNPIEATVDPLVSNLGTVVGTLTGPIPIVGPILSPTGILPVTALNLNVGAILGQVQAGQPLGIQALGPQGQILGPTNCNIGATSLQLAGTQGISIGGNSISGLGSGAAAPAIARTVDSIAFGDNAQTGLSAAGAVAMGADASVGSGAIGGIALGDTAIVGVNAAGSVAIGAGAVVNQANSVALGAGSTTTRGAQTGYSAVGLGAGQASTGELNIGGRTLTGLAAGAALGDAVNVSQLTSVANALGSTAASLGGGAGYDPTTGAFTPPSFLVQGAARPTVGAALTALDGQVSTNTTSITNLTNGTVGLVQQATAGGPITVGAGVGGTVVGLAGTGGPRTLTGVAGGVVAAGSTQAVNGGQLFATNSAVLGLNTGLTGTAAALGGGALYDPATGAFTPPSFLVQGAARPTVDAALTALDGQVSTNTTNITNLTNGTVGLIQQATATSPITVAAATGGTSVGFAGAAGARVLTGVGAGAVTAASADAVTGAQLFATNTTLGTLGAGTAASLGAGASFDPATGVFAPPAFVLNAVSGVGTETFATVDGALGNLDDRTLENTTNITNIANGTVGLVQQLATGGPITIGAGVGGTTVSISGTGGVRTLTGLGAGLVADTSTDAVTGAQLFATNTAVLGLNTGVAGTAGALGAGASYDPVTGVFAPPAFVLNAVSGVGTETFATVDGALGNLDDRTLENTTNIANIANGTVGLVQQLAAGGPITVGAGVAGDTVDIAGTAGVRTLTGVADGDLTAVSTEAVTGAQLFATNTAVGTLNTGLTNTAALIGAGAAYDPATGTFTPPSFALQGGTVVETTVGGAIANLDTRTTDLAGQIGSGAIGLVQQAGPTAPITVAAATGGTLVNFAGTAGARTLTGVGAGALTATSTDAVTGAQLFATNTAVGTLGTGLAGAAGALGGGASYNPATGVFTPPSYFVQGAARTDVGTALSALDGQVNINTTDIANLQVQVGQAGVGLVQQAAPGADLTVGVNTDGDAVRFNQAGGATRLVTGLTDGAVAAGSTDAVTGNQAFATTNSIASALGGGAAVAADGTVTAPTYTIGGTGFTDAGSAFAALDTSVTALQNQVGALDPGGNLAFVSVNTTQGPARATGTETVAIGGGAVASGANSSAYGSGASALGAGSSAFGAGASAGFDNSSAFGAGASATRANQMVFGTASNTYTMPGVTSAASRAAQSGPIDLVTTDAAGNLASLPLSDFFSGVSAIEAELGRMDRKFDRQSDGIAIAMALGAVALPADKTFALTGSVGYFDDTAAFGIGAVGQIADNWYLNGGVGVGTERGTVAGRAGLTYAW